MPGNKFNACPRCGKKADVAINSGGIGMNARVSGKCTNCGFCLIARRWEDLLEGWKNWPKIQRQKERIALRIKKILRRKRRIQEAEK